MCLPSTVEVIIICDIGPTKRRLIILRFHTKTQPGHGGGPSVVVELYKTPAGINAIRVSTSAPRCFPFLSPACRPFLSFSSNPTVVFWTYFPLYLRRTRRLAWGVPALTNSEPAALLGLSCSYEETAPGVMGNIELPADHSVISWVVGGGGGGVQRRWLRFRLDVVAVLLVSVAFAEIVVWKGRQGSGGFAKS